MNLRTCIRAITCLSLLWVALAICGCGDDRSGPKDGRTAALEVEATTQKARAVAAELQAERATKTNAELRQRIAQNDGIIKAAQDDNAASRKQIAANDEAHWTTLAYIAAGVLALAALVLGFLAFESPIARLKFAAGATFCGVMAVACIWIGREIHLILALAPWFVAAAVIIGIWGAIDHRRIRAFLTHMWVKTSTELEAHAPVVAAQLDAASLALQGVKPGKSTMMSDVVDHLLATHRAGV